MKTIRDVEQGSSEWQALRRCKITGTKLADVMGTPAARKKLIACLVAEEGTEQTKFTKPTASMERGVAEEVFARKAYEAKFKVKVEQATMLISDKYPWFGVSPDGLIKQGKIYREQLEIKNPDSDTMVSYRLGEGMCDMGIPKDYKWQVVASFMVNEDLEKMHFVVYDARFIEEEHKMLVVTVLRSNPALQKAMVEAERWLLDFRKEWLECKEKVLPSNF